MKRVCASIAVGTILLVTLMPLGDGGPQAYSCSIGCERQVADFLLNVLLFVPLGISLRILGFSYRTAGLVGFLLSGGVEVVQLLVPGRFPGYSDLASNSLGSILGSGLPSVAQLIRTMSARAYSRVAFVLVAGFAAVIGVTGFLVEPVHTSGSPYYGQWTANLGFMDWYRATVLEVTLAGYLPLESQQLDDTPEVKRLLSLGETLRIEALAGPPTERLGPLFSIFDSAQNEILVIGPKQEDLLIRRRTRAHSIGLDQPSVRIPNLFLGVAEGDHLSVSLAGIPPNTCVTLNNNEVCDLGYSFGIGWGFFLYLDLPPRPVIVLLGSFWSLLLVVPIGFFAVKGGKLTTTQTGVAVILVLAVAPGYAGLLPTPPSEWLGGLCGFIAGGVGGRWLS